ncbi:hypothetical protein OS493_008597 [Desmophyllum pertusum]|uniref:Uncharacterized protein n=1 Tax=Desmophyllum pertusum TaxID=174260 RepID=A0A9W9ZS31_9CNID|nr:hypothetical protein OS493_008597 [Desmophyllum pertusum]
MSVRSNSRPNESHEEAGKHQSQAPLENPCWKCRKQSGAEILLYYPGKVPAGRLAHPQSTVHSESDPTKDSALSNSSEDIKKEIEDLEFRITSDKKRLLKLLIKQERTKAVDAIDLEEESENAPQEDDEGPG